MPSQFSITPAGDLSWGLSGLSSVLEHTRQQRKEREVLEAKAAYDEEAKAAMIQGMRTGDPEVMMELSVQYPEYMKQAQEMATMQTDITQEDRLDFMREALTNPRKIPELYEERIQDTQDRGRDPSHTVQSYQEFMEDPGTKYQQMKMMFAAMAPEEYKTLQKDDKSTTAFQTLKERAEAGGLKEGTAAYQEFMRYGGSAPKTGGLADQRERKIQQYQDRFGMSLNDATRAVDSATMMDDKGNLISFDPISGEGTLVDVDTGAERPVIQPPEGVAVEDLAFDPSQGTGFGASFIGLWNATLGQLPLMPIGEETEMAAQNLRVLERDAIRALASSGRPPVIEQQRIAALIPEAMSFTQNPEVAKYKMTNFIDLMMNQYVDDKRFMDDRANPKSVREDSARRSKEIESIVRRVLTPEAADAMFQSLDKVEAEIGEVRTASFGDLLDIDPASLSQTQRDIYIQRLRAGE